MLQLQLLVNGSNHVLDVADHETLVEVLRGRLGLTGTKVSCGRGECGACTVLMSTSDGDRFPVYSCLTLAAAALLDSNPSPEESDIRAALSGNLCRCGTYPKIVLAVQDAARRLSRGE